MSSRRWLGDGGVGPSSAEGHMKVSYITRTCINLTAVVSVSAAEAGSAGKDEGVRADKPITEKRRVLGK